MRRTLTESNWTELGRITRSARKRPDAPRGLRYDAASYRLLWEAPPKNKDITHYRIYADNDQNLVREVPSSQLYLQDNLATDIVFVTAYNKPLQTESAPTYLRAPIAPPSGGLIASISVTDDDQTVDEPVTTDDGFTVAAAAIGSLLVIFFTQDGTGGHYLSWGSEMYGHGNNVGIDPNQTTSFMFVKRQNTTPKWWGVGVPRIYE